jgi:hypothetical protein
VCCAFFYYAAEFCQFNPSNPAQLLQRDVACHDGQHNADLTALLTSSLQETKEQELRQAFNAYLQGFRCMHTAYNVDPLVSCKKFSTVQCHCLR